jgi:hypothetical protein
MKEESRLKREELAIICAAKYTALSFLGFTSLQF